MTDSKQEPLTPNPCPYSGGSWDACPDCIEPSKCEHSKKAANIQDPDFEEPEYTRLNAQRNAMQAREEARIKAPLQAQLDAIKAELGLTGLSYEPDLAAALRAQVVTLQARVVELEAECAAMRAQARLPEDYCLACGGTGGHEEGCRGTTGLIALTQQLAACEKQWRPIAEAPKDGHFLGWIPWGQGIEECSFVCAYSRHYERIVLVMSPETRIEVTHFQPLPPPPADAAMSPDKAMTIADLSKLSDATLTP